jgi:hypothetical protein
MKEEKKMKIKKIHFIAFTIMVLIISVVPASAQRPGFGSLYYNGEIVRTIVPPSAQPQPGVDNLYVVINGAMGQLGIAAVAPGDTDYHGGQWAFYSVMWNVTPYLLTSEEEVLMAESAGDVTVARVPENDFRCPIQP